MTDMIAPGSGPTTARGGAVIDIAETRDLQRIEARLVERFASSVDRTDVRRELFAAYHAFDGAPIRSYVLVLTERVAIVRLAARPVDAAYGRHVVDASA